MTLQERNKIIGEFLRGCTPDELIRAYLTEKSNCNDSDIEQLPLRILTDTSENLQEGIELLIGNNLNKLL